jgi:hypothetical protein
LRSDSHSFLVRRPGDKGRRCHRDIRDFPAEGSESLAQTYIHVVGVVRLGAQGAADTTRRWGARHLLLTYTESEAP